MPLSQKNKLNIAICHVQVPFIRGGAEILVEELTKQLQQRGHKVEIIKIPFLDNAPEKIIENTLVWRMIDIDSSYATGEKIDLVICTKFPAYLINHPNKIVWLFHQYRQAYELSDSQYSNQSDAAKNAHELIKKIDNDFLPQAKRIFTISKNVSKRLKKYNNIESEAVYPGLKNEDKYYCKEFKKYVLFVSRITSIKRPELLIKSIKHVKDQNLKYIFVGKEEGGHLEFLKKLAKEENVEDKIEFKSNYISEEELLELYANCLAVFYAPYEEDYGYITIESFYSKKPVITTTDSGGPLEFVTNGKNGFITKPDNFKAIAKHIDELSSNTNLAKKMGEEGFNTVKDITWEKALNSLLNDF